MSDLVILLDQIQALRDDWVILVFILSNLHQNFNHILNPLTDISFVQHGPESFIYEAIGLGRVFREVSTDFSHEPDGDFDGIISGSFEKEEENLECDDFMSGCSMVSITWYGTLHMCGLT